MAITIVATVPAAADLKDVMDALRAAAIKAGCEAPIVEARYPVDNGHAEIRVTCR